MTIKVRVLSVDAWRDGEGWTWNNWHCLGEAEIPPEGTDPVDVPIGILDMQAAAWDAGFRPAASRRFLRALRTAGYLGSRSGGSASIDNDRSDPMTVTVCKRSNGMPFLAVEFLDSAS